MIFGSNFSIGTSLVSTKPVFGVIYYHVFLRKNGFKLKRFWVAKPFQELLVAFEQCAPSRVPRDEIEVPLTDLGGSFTRCLVSRLGSFFSRANGKDCQQKWDMLIKLVNMGRINSETM